MTISVFLTSIRPRHWIPLYDNICQAAKDLSFEIVVSTPVDPREQPLAQQPDNFKVIQTPVKPSQALEVARIHCQGDYVVQAVDDVRFTPGALVEMFKAVHGGNSVIATCEYWANGGNHRIAMTEGIFGSCGEFPKVATNTPLQPICAMMRRHDWPFADPCFCAQYGELDQFLRRIAEGWTVQMVDAKVEENSAGSDLWRTKGQGDLTTIRKLWRNPTTCDYDPTMRGVPGRYDYSKIIVESQGRIF